MAQPMLIRTDRAHDRLTSPSHQISSVSQRSSTSDACLSVCALYAAQVFQYRSTTMVNLKTTKQSHDDLSVERTPGVSQHPSIQKIFLPFTRPIKPASPQRHGAVLGTHKQLLGATLQSHVVNRDVNRRHCCRYISILRLPLNENNGNSITSPMCHKVHGRGRTRACATGVPIMCVHGDRSTVDLQGSDAHTHTYARRHTCLYACTNACRVVSFLSSHS